MLWSTTILPARLCRTPFSIASCTIRFNSLAACTGIRSGQSGATASFVLGLATVSLPLEHPVLYQLDEVLFSESLGPKLDKQFA